MGIRGAMVDVVLDPPAGTPQHIDMLFGNEVTLEQGQQLLGRLYAAGYSLVLGEGGTFDVMKTLPGWGSQIQAALAGKPGTKGGAPRAPPRTKSASPSSPRTTSRTRIRACRTRNSKPCSRPPHITTSCAISSSTTRRRRALSAALSWMAMVEACRSAQASRSSSTASTTWWRTTPRWPTFAFDADGNPVAIEATFLGSVEECGDDCTVSIVYRGDGTSGEVLLTIPGEDDPMVIEADDNFLYRHDDPRLDNPMLTPVYDEGNPNIQVLADTLDCNNCNAFVKWGFWGFSLGENIGLPDVPGDADYMGTYITGDLTTAAQLNTLAEQSESINTTATYFGDAVGVVHNEALEPGSQDYVATGDLQVDWSFGARAGTVYIDAFDEQNANYYLSYDVTSPTGATGFVGTARHRGLRHVRHGAGRLRQQWVGHWRGRHRQLGFPSPTSLETPVYSASGMFMGERGVIDP